LTERCLSARGTRFAIATPHVAATRAGAAAFDAGGNAVDAALAAAVTLAVVYPHMCGVGGDLFALVQEPDGRTIALNASGAAPRAVDVEAVRALEPTMPAYGPLSVTVPGAVSGWAALHRLGAALPLARALDGAVLLARDGIQVAPSLARNLAWNSERLRSDPGFSAVFFRDGRPLAERDLLAQTALAGTLEAIAERGPQALYGGPVGERLVERLRAGGSSMTLDDLAAHEPELDSAITLRYRDLHVSVVPPNSQGFALLEILGAVERLGIDPDPLGPDAALLAEVFRVTSADRDRHNADPRSARVPVGTLLDDGHLAALADQVRTAEQVRTAQVPTRLDGDTVALVAADAEGRAVSLIQSLSDGFGSGILEPSTGVILHNRGSGFSLDPTSPNVLAGGKRPAHTLMPVLVHRDGRLAAVSGSMGGGGQPQINFQNLVRVFDLGMSPEAALDAARWLAGGMDVDNPERFVEAEARVPHDVRSTLEAAGYRLELLGERDEGVGHAHLITIAPDGTLEAATDPRADGGADAR
jgi:gamma-glutamyltranspeptidase/glutathione hydrolase